MRKERLEIVELVQQQLYASEIAVEAALSAIARLTVTMPEARARAGISPIAGQPAFDSIGAALAGIIVVRGHMVETHAQLDATREQFRMPVVATGGGFEKPPRAGIEAGGPDLHVVAA
jgi:hypothetical protein